MTELEFYKHIAIISSMIKDGHTILLPSPTNINFHYSMSHFLSISFCNSKPPIIHRYGLY